MHRYNKTKQQQKKKETKTNNTCVFTHVVSILEAADSTAGKPRCNN